MGRGGGFSPICFLKGVRGGYFRFLVLRRCGVSTIFYGFFSSGIGWSRIFVLKGEIERDMGRENNRGGFAFFLRSVSSCVGLYSL